MHESLNIRSFIRTDPFTYKLNNIILIDRVARAFDALEKIIYLILMHVLA